MSENFNDMTFFCAPIPTYYGGFMTFAWGSDSTSNRQLDVSELTKRFKQLGLNTRYYNPAIHQASFALPQYVVNAIDRA